MTFKPMLAGNITDIATLNFPLFGSPKLDGIRCVILNGAAVTRNLKPIPNDHIRNFLSIPMLNGVDGEIMLKKGDFNSVQSAVMSADGVPDFYYAVFDYHPHTTMPYIDRLKLLADIVEKLANPRIVLVPQIEINSIKDVVEFEHESLLDGYEGIMLRHPRGHYKHGRSTIREAKLMKLKRFHDEEATIVSVEPLYENRNKPTVNALGHTERSSHQENLVPQKMVGALVVRLSNDKEFSIGTGFDDATRKRLWVDQKKIIGKLVKFKYQELSSEGIPRFPVFLGLRDERDMSS